MSSTSAPKLRLASTREDRAVQGVIASYLHDLTPHDRPRVWDLQLAQPDDEPATQDDDQLVVQRQAA